MLECCKMNRELNRAHCITSLLEGIEGAQQPSRDIIKAYWTNIFIQSANSTKLQHL